MPARLELSLLGTAAIKLNGELVNGRVPAKSQGLLFYLAVTGRRHSREKLAGLFWGEKPEDKANANLRKSLSTLRKSFASALIITRQSVAFNHDSDFWLDVEVFESALAQGSAGPESLRQLHEAVEHYRGEFLEGFSVREAGAFEEWVLGERERLRQLAIQALNRLSEAHTSQGDYDAAIEYTNRLLMLEPWAEEAHRQLMNLLARSGQPSAALAQYEACRAILAEELGVEPLPETQALYQRLLSRREDVPHNIPPQNTPFVGRQVELAHIASHLNQADCRLLTLIGVGGIGKTRLALQAGLQALKLFPDGVFFVPLARINGHEYLAPSIMEAIDCPLSQKADSRRQLLEYLQPKEMLLVLDNFEHLLSSARGNQGGIDLLLDIVKAAPKVKLLVTSRERLNLQLEWLLSVHGLPYPLEETAYGEKKYEAVELFANRAGRLQPDFSLAREWPEVVRICGLLEGMPLGIELAASWVSIMPCYEIAEEIAKGLDLLSTTLHDLPARHKSLEAVFDHSWKLLSESEQQVFTELSVFRGGFDRRAAEKVTGASLSSLAVLVNKSLLRTTPHGRYDMLEPLKQYAATKLAQMPVSNDVNLLQGGDSDTSYPDQVQQRHAHYYLSLAESAEEAIGGPEQLKWQGRLDIEGDNLRTALGWALGEKGERATLGLKLAGTLGLFWRMRSHLWSEGYRWLEIALQNGDGTPKSVRAKALLSAGVLQFHQWRFDQALPFFRESKELYQEVGDLNGVAEATHWLGRYSFRKKEYSEATKLLEASLEMYREVNDKHGELITVRSLGDCARLLKDYEHSKRLYEQGLILSQESDNRLGAAGILNSLGELARLQGDLETAKKRCEESLALEREIGNELSEAVSLHNLAHTTLSMGDLWGAYAQFTDSLCLFQKLDYPRGITLCLVGFAGVAAVTGQAKRAAKLLGKAQAALEASKVPLPLGPADQAAFDRYLATVESQLDPQDLTDSWALGQRMSLSQGVAYALELAAGAQPFS